MNRNITAIILIVLAGGIYVTFTSPRIDEVKAIRAINDQYTSAITNADKLVKVREEILKQYNSLSENDRTRLDKMLPNTVDNIRLIIDLNSIAVRKGFSLRNVKAVASGTSQKQAAPASAPQSSSGARIGIPTPILDTVTISFSVSAPYQQFIELMKDLESNLRIMDMTHLTVAANATGNYDFGVELKTYWLRQQ